MSSRIWQWNKYLGSDNTVELELAYVLNSYQYNNERIKYWYHLIRIIIFKWNSIDSIPIMERRFNRIRFKVYRQLLVLNSNGWTGMISKSLYNLKPGMGYDISIIIMVNIVLLSRNIYSMTLCIIYQQQ